MAGIGRGNQFDQSSSQRRLGSPGNGTQQEPAEIPAFAGVTFQADRSDSNPDADGRQGRMVTIATPCGGTVAV